MARQPRSRPSRGEVWRVALDPAAGSEIHKTRLCVVVSPPEINENLRVVLVAPLTSGRRPVPFRIPTTVNGQPGLMLLEQIRAVDVNSLVKRIGQLDRLALGSALAVLRALFAD